METIMYFFMIFLSAQHPVDSQKNYSEEISKYEIIIEPDGSVSFRMANNSGNIDVALQLGPR